MKTKSYKFTEVKELKNTRFAYDPEQKVFEIATFTPYGDDYPPDLNKVYLSKVHAFSLMRFILRFAQKQPTRKVTPRLTKKDLIKKAKRFKSLIVKDKNDKT